MSRFRLSLVSSAGSARHMPQKSFATRFAPQGGRGRDRAAHRRVSVQPVIGRRDDFLVWWSALMLRRCGSAHQIAMTFDVTEQTGRNWIDAVACPSGWVVFQAQARWPEDFAAVA